MTRAGYSRSVMPHEITLQKAAAEQKNKENRDKRLKDMLLSASCLTCTYTKVALGKKLVCKVRDKLVNQYNYCESWKELSPKTLAEEALKLESTK